MKKIVLLLLSVFCFFSCSSKNEGIPVSEETMSKIIYDLMKGKKELNYRGVPGDSVAIYFESYVKPNVLRVYNVSKADFDTSYVRLSRNPARFELLWKDVKVVADSAFKTFE